MRFREPTLKEQRDWARFARSRPPVVRAIFERLNPWTLYRLQGKERVTLYSAHEDGTVTVVITGRFNKVMFDRRVFGIAPDDLVECDLPGPDEELGTVLNQDEARDWIATQKARQ